MQLFFYEQRQDTFRTHLAPKAVRNTMPGGYTLSTYMLYTLVHTRHVKYLTYFRNLCDAAKWWITYDGMIPEPQRIAV